LIIGIYSCRDWKKPISAKIDLNGEEEVVKSIANSIVDKLCGTREVYYADYAGAFCDDRRTILVRESLDVIVHEAFHRYIDNIGLSTSQGLPIEEAASLVIDEFATRNEDRVQRHLRSSRAFAKLYNEVMRRKDSKSVRQAILRTAKRHAYDDAMQENPDPRISPWAYLTDDLKYMLLYQLCFDLTRKGIDHAQSRYIESLKAVKETGVLQDGVELLKAHATKRVRDLYDFRVEPFDEDMKKVYDNMANGNPAVPGFPHAKVYGNDRKAYRMMVCVIENYRKFFERKWTRFINEHTSNVSYAEIEGYQDSEIQTG